jgi:fumarate reductase subunit D
MWKWLWAPVVVLLIGLSFLLGLSFGLGKSSAPFVTEVVPVLSMLGAWVSGIGTLAAVITTLWLSQKQQREDTESLKVSLHAGLIGADNPWFISVQVVSDGKRPATIRGIAFTSPHAKHACHLTEFMHYGSQLPVQISYGEKADFMLSYGADAELREFVAQYCGGKADGLAVVVSTNLSSFEAPVSQGILSVNT